MRSPQLIVHEHDPIKRWILILALIFVVIAGGFLLYDYGRSRADFDFASLESEREVMHEQLEKLTNDIDTLQQQLVASKRIGAIEKQAYSEVDNSLSVLQAEILELKEEVAFYRSIVAPRESSRGLHIQRFKITPTAQDKTYRYKLVLTQVIKNNRITRGKVLIKFEGVQNGKHRTMTLVDMSSGNKEKLPFKFKYFQKLEGDIILPDGFAPSRVSIKVISNRVTLDKTFNWTGTSVSSNGSLKVSML